jgi:AcrR family transcriptional regulator
VHILSHSTSIASVDGLEGLTLGRVAAEAGVGKGNIQALFGDREALQLATLQSAVNMYKELVLEPALRRSSPMERLFALVEGWYSFVESRTLPGGCFLNAVSSEYRARPGRIRDQIETHRAETRSRFRNLIADAKAAGEFRFDVDEARLAFELVSYQATANIAALMGDEEDFALARKSSMERLADAVA